MTRPGRAARPGAASSVAALLAAFLVTIMATALPGAAAPASAAQRLGSRHAAGSGSGYPIDVRVEQMSPWTPAPSATAHSFSITVSLSNTSDADIDGLRLQVGRGSPFVSQSGLTSSSTDASLPTGLYPVPAHPAAKGTIDVPAGQSVDATFTTTTSVNKPYRLCLCANAVYPLYVSAYDTSAHRVDGFTRTYVAAVDKQTDSEGDSFAKTDVTWIWPLLDRPHRTTDGRVFTDNDLAQEIAAGGRLDHGLQVVEDAGQNVPLTVMLDPDLIDELAVMSSGNYTYLSGGRSVRGRDASGAAAWLARLRAVIADDPDVSLQFTPYADPAVQSLTDNGLSWRTAIPATMLARVEKALGGLSTLPSTLSWPPGEAVSGRTLARLAANGTTSVLLNESDVSPSDTGGQSLSLASLRTSHGTMLAPLVSTAMQTQVADAVGNADPDLSHLPPLLAQLAVRADTDPYGHRLAVLTPPRYVDPSPAAAATVIRETSSSAVTQPVSLATALDASANQAPVTAHVRSAPTSGQKLSALVVANAEQVSSSLAAVRDLLIGPQPSTSAEALVSQLPRALQRAESAAWSTGAPNARPGLGLVVSTQLRRQVSGLLGGVQIVRPAGGHYSYTLASKNSPLPITVENTLPYRAFVSIAVTTIGGTPGLTTTALRNRPIAPESKQTFRVPAYVQRSGRYQLTATLSTADDSYVLGPQVRLSVRSTVFGTIGIVITVVAAVVLLLALAYRYLRRWQRLRRKRHPSVPPRAVSSPERVP